jgi:response regulator NasT
MIEAGQPRALRVVVADERPQAIEEAARLVAQAGHQVVRQESERPALAGAIAASGAEVAVVAVDRDPVHALDLVEAIHAGTSCPVVLLLHDDDPALVHAALTRGVTAYADRATPGAVESAIELAWRRFAETRRLADQVHDLESGAERRALIERAKGVLMERHDIDERSAYEMLRSRARAARIPGFELAEAVLRGQPLLRPQGRAEPGDAG